MGTRHELHYQQALYTLSFGEVGTYVESLSQLYTNMSLILA